MPEMKPHVHAQHRREHGRLCPQWQAFVRTTICLALGCMPHITAFVPSPLSFGFGASRPDDCSRPLLHGRGDKLLTRSAQVEGETSGSTSTAQEAGANKLTTSDMVPFTSRMIAAARATESREADRLFDDPFAEILAGAEGMRFYEEGLASDEFRRVIDGPLPFDSSVHESRRLAIRTRFGDDFFEDNTVGRGVKQVVFLGAGMDTRALRLRATHGTKVYEVDQDLVHHAKRTLLGQAPVRDEGCVNDSHEIGRAHVVSVEADLSLPGWESKLFASGFDPALPSAWVLEGLTMYLEEKDVVGLLKSVSELCSPGSSLFITFFSAGTVERAQASGTDLMAQWKWGTDDPKAFLTDNFPPEWAFNAVLCGTPGAYPDGADYSLSFRPRGDIYAVGYC